jgi:steroid 5-alpha reductase family enzyme
MILKHPINLHKGATALVVIVLMIYYQNFSVAVWLYLALHGSYGFLWLLKDRIFPDAQWERKVSTSYGIFVFFALGLYWLAPWLLITTNANPPHWMMGLAVALNIFGVMLHFSSDAQKYYTLKYKTGLITEGFFARCRNTNYLGELMIYCGFALLANHWLAFLGIAVFFGGAFIPNMLRKDKSLSRYPEFTGYKKRSGLMWPKPF